VITGYATLEKALQSFHVGSFDFIPKPFDTETFLAVTFRGLKHSRVTRDKDPLDHDYVPVEESVSIRGGLDIVYCLGCHAQAKLQEDGTALIRVGETFPHMMDNLSRIETGVVSQQPKPVQIEEVLKGIVDFLGIRAKAKTQSLSLSERHIRRKKYLFTSRIIKEYYFSASP